ncbi:MAG: VOC family protein [Bacteroidia bacterium]|jgi:predicted 3-demethylubiquinone-9 3-methyltransferase (glyoxalase superfamily)|nr:VOC family protein [Bacteroidia bacterium]
MIQSKITPFIWLKSGAEEAAKFYTSVFPNSELGKVVTMGGSDKVITASCILEGVNFTFLNDANCSPTDAISFVIHCKTQEEVDHYWSKLLDGGMELACGWLRDKYGIAWQVTPERLITLMHHPDAEKAGKVMQAMMQMKKIIIADLEAAAL